MDRRKHLGVTSAQRAAAIKDIYRPLHPHVYHLQVVTALTIIGIVNNETLTP